MLFLHLWEGWRYKPTLLERMSISSKLGSPDLDYGGWERRRSEKGKALGGRSVLWAAWDKRRWRAGTQEEGFVAEWSGEDIRTRRYFRSSCAPVAGRGHDGCGGGEAAAWGYGKAFTRLGSQPLRCSSGQGQQGKPEVHVVEISYRVKVLYFHASEKISQLLRKSQNLENLFTEPKRDRRLRVTPKQIRNKNLQKHLLPHVFFFFLFSQCVIWISVHN